MIKKRRNTNTVSIGDLRIGGNQPIRIQSMLTSETTNVEACIQEIKKLDAVGCEIIRLTVPNQKSVESLAVIKKRMKILLRVVLKKKKMKMKGKINK